MKVKMLVNTRFGGKPLKKGTELEVPANVADRWEKNRIAQPLKAKGADNPKTAPKA